MHNLVVFDNIVSYIFYGVLLALIHSQIAKDKTPLWSSVEVHKDVVVAVITPLVVVVTGLTMYLLHSPGMYAAGDMIDALRANNPDTMLAEFRVALDRDSFANQEIREQLTQRVQGALSSPQISEETKIKLFSAVEQELLEQIEEKPGDARLHVFISTFYRNAGQLERAKAELEVARSLSPNKQAIILEQGIVAYQMQDIETAHAFFKEAYELAPEFPAARTFYIATLTLRGEDQEAIPLLEGKFLRHAAQNPVVRSVVNETNAHPVQVIISEYRIEKNPDVAQHRVDLAVAQHGLGDTEAAIETLNEAIAVIPEFALQGQSYIEDLRAGREPGSSN